MRIFLIGFMGSGKSHVGKRLAQLLGWDFVDLDDYLEQQEGRSINDIFAQDGADHFRKLEQHYLHKVITHPKIIVATGGGAPCFFDNLQWMNRHGLTIYLNTPISILTERLQYGMEHRPLLQGKTYWELKDFISDKLVERSNYYEGASVIYKINDAKQLVAKELYNNFAQIIGH